MLCPELLKMLHSKCWHIAFQQKNEGGHHPYCTVHYLTVLLLSIGTVLLVIVSTPTTVHTVVYYYYCTSHDVCDKVKRSRFVADRAVTSWLPRVSCTVPVQHRSLNGSAYGTTKYNVRPVRYVLRTQSDPPAWCVARACVRTFRHFRKYVIGV